MLEYWNVGILGFGKLGFGLRLVEPTARRGNWDVGTLVKFVDMGGKVSNSKNIPLKTTPINAGSSTFHYSMCGAKTADPEKYPCFQTVVEIPRRLIR
jgi:hypothetical protein